MPTQDWINKHGKNPFAICHANGLKRGDPKYERCIKHIVEQENMRKGAKKALKGESNNG